eukprot:2097875-Amphidinium_carterae.1
MSTNPPLRSTAAGNSSATARAAPPNDRLTSVSRHIPPLLRQLDPKLAEPWQLRWELHVAIVVHSHQRCVAVILLGEAVAVDRVVDAINADKTDAVDRAVDAINADEVNAVDRVVDAINADKADAVDRVVDAISVDKVDAVDRVVDDAILKNAIVVFSAENRRGR